MYQLSGMNIVIYAMRIYRTYMCMARQIPGYIIKYPLYLFDNVSYVILFDLVHRTSIRVYMYTCTHTISVRSQI